MEKQIVRWTYLLGLACVGVALLWRAGTLAGLGDQFRSLTYLSFVKGAVLFLLTSIATQNYAASLKS